MTGNCLVADLELDLLLDAVKTRYGYDFRDYAKASMVRRVRKYMDKTGIHHVSELIPLFLHDSRAFYQFVRSLSVVVTEMFRDPEVFKVLREEVVPVLKTYPFVKIWHAGCASGEEVYSMAILLEEEEFWIVVRYTPRTSTMMLSNWPKKVSIRQEILSFMNKTTVFLEESFS